MSDWNLARNNLQSLLIEFVIENDLDFLFIAEHSSIADDFIIQLNTLSPHTYKQLESGKCDKVKAFTRRSLSTVGLASSSSRYAAYHVDIVQSIPPRKLLIFAVHLIDPYNHSLTTRSRYILKLKASIEDTERSLGSNNTLLIGDFNMNPHDYGISGVNYLGALNSKIAAKRNTIKYLDEEHSLFYNPT
ncbi:endonuclease/exonuclease/phosphatase family protein [Deinococcus sp. 6GRE01]|uniref:endonuclease/exonuclease/phosphatase family protein n=1 Tax=Deinococcus sp. 6GRE01 TaxID=2745873 RepID=UPI001E2ABB46|nr:endonuclease/exonuclease/phosphatase family protein [Deinococcus sp. 6GRE01]